MTINLDAIERTECDCDDCRSACTGKPGWFLPGEAEQAAELLGMSLVELFKSKLAVDWYEDHPDTDAYVFVLAPALVGESAGEEYPGDPNGQCVFYEGGRCDIHAAKPFECAALGHQEADIRGRHEAVAGRWVGHHEQIVELLEGEPVPSSYEGGGLFGGLLSMFGGTYDDG